MTTAVAEVPVAPRRRRRRLWLVVAAVIVAVVAITATVLVRRADPDEGYGPLERGGSFGYGGPGIVRTEQDGQTVVRLGTGPAYAFSDLSNAGTRAVRITGVDRDGENRDARWAPLPFGTEPAFEPPRWRPFPATVPPDGSIQLRLTIGRSTSCANVDPASGANLTYRGAYRVHWRSREAEHETFVEGNDAGRPLLLC